MNILNENCRCLLVEPSLWRTFEPKGRSELSVSTAFLTLEALLRFSRDIELNEVCKELCIEETLTCLSKCDDTDCNATCLRAEATCLDRKLSDI